MSERPTTEETAEIMHSLGSTAEAICAAAQTNIEVLYERTSEAIRRVEAYPKLMKALRDSNDILVGVLERDDVISECSVQILHNRDLLKAEDDGDE